MSADAFWPQMSLSSCFSIRFGGTFGCHWWNPVEKHCRNLCLKVFDSLIIASLTEHITPTSGYRSDSATGDIQGGNSGAQMR